MTVTVKKIFSFDKNDVRHNLKQQQKQPFSDVSTRIYYDQDIFDIIVNFQDITLNGICFKRIRIFYR